MMRVRPAWMAVVAGAVLVAAGGAGGAALLLDAREPAAARGAPRFAGEAEAAGVTHRYDGDFNHVVGGGVAILDCDDDGRPDLFFAGGERRSALFRNVGQPAGSLSFEPLPSAATELTAVSGAYPVDVDGDGVLDLAVLRVGENVMLRGTGGCRFEAANDRWRVDGGEAWTTAFSATWESEGLPTLAFGNYLVRDDPERSTCDRNELIRPATDGRYGEPIGLEPGWCTLSMLFSDWDRSGRRDLRVSNDRHYYRDGEEQLWRVETGADPELWTADDGWRTVRIFGMGIASRDLTGDGRPEVYLTSQGDNKLQTLVDGATGPSYEDIALRRAATAHRPYAGDTALPSTAWHPEFADVNNDGFVDLFVTKGNVEAQADHAARDPNNLLIGQPDGSFVEGAPDAGIVSFARGRGAGVADLNLDGLLDIVVVNRGDNVELWRNLGPAGATGDAGSAHWVSVRPQQPGANRDAVGAWVQVRAGARSWVVERTIGGGHASGQLGWLHFGLGEADRAEVRVTWPDGHAGPWQQVEVDGWTVIDRDRGVRFSEPASGP